MKFITLIENESCCDGLHAEHGLSFYLETEHHKILFDAGQTAAFADNAARLGVDPASVDLAILSHGHYDHSGGLEAFLKQNTTAPVYVTPDVFGMHLNAEGRDIGVNPALEHHPRLIYSEDGMQIGKELTLYTCNHNEMPYGAEAYGLSMVENGRITDDDFRHEQYLVIEEGEKRILISGCSHKGILNLVSWFRPDVLIGGFHFMKIEPEGEGLRRLQEAADTLLSYPTVYYTGHCTGDRQFAVLKERMGDRLIRISAGSCFTV